MLVRQVGVEYHSDIIPVNGILSLPLSVARLD